MNPVGGFEAETIWHDAECGGYTADLSAWEVVCSEAETVLDLGAGAGRVAVHLAQLGHLVTAIDHSPALIEELERRAGAGDLSVDATVADVRELSLETRFDAVIAPMQLIQLMRGSAERARLLSVMSSHLAPGGVAALAIVEGSGGDPVAEPTLPMPDVRENDGWIYSSLPLSVRVRDGAIEILRLRQVVSPAGQLTDERELILLELVSEASLAVEADSTGLELEEAWDVPAGDDHIGSRLLRFRGSR